MSGVNKVIVMGYLGRDPELSYSNGGKAICKFSLATSKKKKDGTEVTSWHKCTALGKTAELITQYVGKGQQLYIEGELSYGQYEKDGIVRYTTDIIVNEISFVGAAKGGQQNYDGQMPQPPQNNFQQPQQQYQQRPNQTQNQQQYPQQQQFNMVPPDDESIPF